MISRLRGTIEELHPERAVLRVGELCYEVLIPSAIHGKLRARMDREEDVELFTLHYVEGGAGGGNLIPRLVGFLSRAEREFFSRLITVKGLGVRKALRCLSIPVGKFALAIERSDSATLARLPEVGRRTADKIVAELQGKVMEFALVPEDEAPEAPLPEAGDAGEEVEAVLLQLGYKIAEARAMVERALRNLDGEVTTDSLLQEIFRQQKIKGGG